MGMSLPNLSAVNWIMLAALLALAVWQDLAHRRIPNRLLLCFASAGVLLAVLPQGIGLASALGAAFIAGAAFAPLYLLRQMGGGDLKLMTTTGLMVGMPRVTALCLSVAMAGGLLALWWLWRARRRAHTQTATTDRMPYAVAVALGCAAHSVVALPLTPVSL